MRKESVLVVFVAAIMVVGLIFAVNVNFGTAQNVGTLHIISGYVFDPSGHTVPGALTYLINSTGSSFNSGHYSDSSGFYYMFAPAGTYRLVVRGLSGSGTSYSEANIVLDSDIIKNVTLVPGFKISGYILDSSGNRIAGASNSINNSTWAVPAITTDSSGYYTVYAPAGTYNFIIWPPFNTNLVNYEDQSFVVSSDMTQDITLVSGFKVSGYVRYPSGEIVSGASTRLVHSNGSSFSSGHWSSSSGFYAIAAPAGAYRLVVRGLSGSGTSYSEANIVLDSDITKDIVLIDVSISPSSVTLDVGQSHLFTATASGGSGTYTAYAWYVNGTAKSAQSSPTFSFSPVSAGSYLITAVVTDSSGATSSRSAVVCVTANSALAAPDISASEAMVDQSQTSVLSSTAVSTGTRPYSYQWCAKAPDDSSYLAISGATSVCYSFVTSDSTAVGVWSFVLNVTDSATAPVTVTSAEVIVTVNAAPTVTVSPKPVALNVAQSQLFTATPRDGSGSYTRYQWYVDGVAQLGQTESTFTGSFVSVGSHLVTVTVTDSLNVTSVQASAVPVTVNPALIAPTATPEPSTIFQGQTSTLTASVTTGTPSYTYNWYSKAPGLSSYSAINGATSSSYSFATSLSSAIGVWSFKVQVTDATGEVVNSAEVPVTVNPPLTVAVSPGTAALDVGQSHLFTATASGGSGTYITYIWYVNGDAQSDQTGSTFNYSPTSAGSYSITATVTDSSGAASSRSDAATIEASVTPTPTPTPTASITTPAPTATVAPTGSALPSATQNSQQGSNIEPYIVPIAVAVIIIAAIAVAVLVVGKRKNLTKR